MLSIDGLVSGLDTTTIIDGLLQIQQQRVQQLSARKADILEEQTSFKGIEAGLVNLQSRLSALTRARDSAFKSKTVTSSDDSLAVAAASSDAVEGVYNLRINSLAKAHQIGSQGFSSPDATITEGEIAIQIGTSPVTSVTIDSSNNTLQGLADSINASDAGVNAFVINDGSTTDSYRLLLTSQTAGLSGSISVTNNLAASSGGATQPDFSGIAIQEAANASVTIGSGAGALDVEFESNQVDGLIDGVTIDLVGADANKDITLTIGRDTETAVEAVDGFVESFNSLMEYIDNQVRYDAETEQASVLLGNRSATGIQDEVRSLVTSSVPGLGSLNRLSSLGITVSDSGRLVLNQGQLEDALAEPNADEEITRLFALDARSDNANIRFLFGSSRTNASSDPYQVEITQAAERASITGTNVLAASILVDGTNNEFTVTIDGKESETLTMAAGTYTQDELAEHLQATINASEELANRSVTAVASGGQLVITSAAYGSASEVSIGSGTALATLGLTGSETDNGSDVVGRFYVNGQMESAKGTGQVLIGDADNENTADLQLRVTLTPSQVQSGLTSDLTVTRGLASQLDSLISKLRDPVNGRFTTENEQYNTRIESIEESITTANELFEAQRESLVRQFAALERNLSDLQSTSSFLAGQLAGFQ